MTEKIENILAMVHNQNMFEGRKTMINSNCLLGIKEESKLF